MVQLSAHAIKTGELAKSTQETYEATSSYLQEMLKTQQEQKQTIEEQKQIIEAQAKELKKVTEKAKESIEEPPSIRSPDSVTGRDAASECGGSQSGQGHYLCYRCHRYCGKNAKQCEASIESLLTSSLVDLFSRVVIRGGTDERGMAEVTQEIARRGFKAPEHGKEAKSLREALLAFEQDPTKIVPVEHRIEVTPLTPGVTVEDVTEAPAAPTTPEAVVSSAPSAPSSGELLSNPARGRRLHEQHDYGPRSSGDELVRVFGLSPCAVRCKCTFKAEGCLTR